MKRPEWAETSPSMRDYYDHYWGCQTMMKPTYLRC